MARSGRQKPLGPAASLNIDEEQLNLPELFAKVSNPCNILQGQNELLSYHGTGTPIETNGISVNPDVSQAGTRMVRWSALML